MILIEGAKNLSNVEHVFHTMNNLMNAQDIISRASKELVEENSFIAEKSLNRADEFLAESRKHFSSLLSVDRKRLDSGYNELVLSLGIKVQDLKKKIKLQKSLAARNKQQIPQNNENN